MAVRKKDTNLHEEYGLYLEVGLVLALALLIVAFRVDLETQSSFKVRMEKQETVDMRQIQQTKQEEQPPPPPTPPVPVEVPNNEVIEQKDVTFDASLDISEKLNTSQPPPDPGEKKKEKEQEHEIFVVVEQQPKLIGGMKALQNAVEYPAFAKRAGIEGRVIVQFVVNEEGEVTNPKVTRGVHELLNKAAIEAVKDMKFRPGKQRGDPVKVKMSLPVTFRLKGEG